MNNLTIFSLCRIYSVKPDNLNINFTGISYNINHSALIVRRHPQGLNKKIKPFGNEFGIQPGLFLVVLEKNFLVLKHKIMRAGLLPCAHNLRHILLSIQVFTITCVGS